MKDASSYTVTATAPAQNAGQTGGAVCSVALKVFILTLGCAKNEVDSQKMAEALCQAGCVIADDAAHAECIIVNTCSFIQAATEESIDAIFEMCGLEAVERGEVKLVVAGCMPARYGDELAQSLPEVQSFVPCAKEDDIALVLSGLFPGRLGKGFADISLDEPSAYIKISDGCERFCSFCTIPFIRGRYHSYSQEDIFRDVKNAVARGAKEIVLIAQDTGRWGQDFSEPSSLPVLLRSLAEAFPEIWFRVMYIQPEGVIDDLLDAIAQYDNIASYLDIPFQHANAQILSAMNRSGSGKEYLKLIQHIRSRIPNVALRTTLIAGFPGETEEAFDELCDFVEAAEFDYVGVFAYSREDGTRAAKLSGQLDEDEKEVRARKIRDIADAISYTQVASRIGSTLDVLVLGREEDGQLYGRAQCQAPDIDGVVYLSSGEVGSIVQVIMSDSLMYDMEAK